MKKTDPIIVLAILLVLLSIVLRILSIPHWNWDMSEHNVPWYLTLYHEGYAKTLATDFADYAPPYIYLLALATFTHGLIPPLVAIKLIPICFDIFGAYLVYKLVRLKFKEGNLPVLAAAIYFAAPSILLNSAHWGQVDSLYAVFQLLCIYLLIKEKPLPAMLAAGVSFAIKAQGAFIVPFLAVMSLRKKVPPLYFGLIPLMYLIGITPVVIVGRPFLEALLIYKTQAGTYPELAMSAPNFYPFFQHDWYSVILPLGLVFTAIVLARWIYVTVRSKTSLEPKYVILLAFLSVALTPFLLPKMHDRYFYPADVLSIVLAFYWPGLWFVPILYQLASTGAISIFLFGADSAFIAYGFLFNTVALTVGLRTQRIAEARGATLAWVSSALSWLASILTPVILAGFILSFLLSPAHIRIEYSLPHIPDSSNGLTKSERFDLAAQTMEYLTNTRQSQYLARLKFEDDSPVFNKNEISLLNTAKTTTRSLRQVWFLSLAALYLLGWLAWAGDWLAGLRQGVKRGGGIAIGFAITAGAAALVFNPVSNLEHTLLVLFPPAVWLDSLAFFVIGLSGIGFILTKIKNA